jgi:putative phosphoribosyl transferase
VLNQHLIRAIGITQDEVNTVIAQEKRELQRRQRLYRADRPYPDLHNRTVILVDDGLATGATMYAAVTALRKLEPARLIVAVPVAAKEVCDRFRHLVDEMVCVQTPDPFDGVSRWYADFSQTTDDEVRELLMRANPGAAALPG